MNNKRLQLFILPFAGGSASAFRELSTFLDERIDIHVIEYPGRGTRTGEPFCETMDILIEDAKKQIKESRNEGLPFAMLGYSMGVEVAFDLAQFKLDERPAHLFFAAREAICYPTRGHNYSLLSEEDFTDRIVQLGGIDEKIKNDRRFLKIYMKPVYEDYRLLQQYNCSEKKGVLNSDLTIFYCEEDTCFNKIKEWSEYTTGHTDYYEFGNNHFFIQQHSHDMAEIINGKLLASLMGRRAK